jgi:hypothetical protein
MSFHRDAVQKGTWYAGFAHDKLSVGPRYDVVLANRELQDLLQS